MNKNDFLNELARQLKGIPADEQERYISYYDEIIEDYMENGMTEAETLKKVGAPNKIAAEILAEYQTLTVPSTGNKTLNILLLIITFPFWGSLLVIALSLFIVINVCIWAPPLTTIILTVSFLGASFYTLLYSPLLLLQNTAYGLMQLGSGLTYVGLAGLLGALTVFLAIRMFRVTIRFNGFLIRIIRERVVHL